MPSEPSALNGGTCPLMQVPPLFPQQVNMSELHFLKSAVERAAGRLAYAKREHGAFAARYDRSDPIALRTLRKFEGDVSALYGVEGSQPRELASRLAHAHPGFFAGTALAAMAMVISPVHRPDIDHRGRCYNHRRRRRVIAGGGGATYTVCGARALPTIAPIPNPASPAPTSEPPAFAGAVSDSAATPITTVVIVTFKGSVHWRPSTDFPN